MAQPHLLSPHGFTAGAVHAGIKSSKALDVAILLCDTAASAAAVFTENKVVAAPVTVGRRNIAAGKLRGIVINSGNANACTGKQGEKDALEMCAQAARLTHCRPGEFLPSSTGIIGHMLPMAKVRAGIAAAAKVMGNTAAHADRFGQAILTTDLKTKTAATRIKIGGEFVTLAGVCKGSGMIGPRLSLHATMLAYLTTDAKIPASALRRMLATASDKTFNAVTVDDHPSTNDTAVLLASGHGPRVASARDTKLFTAALNEVCQSLAKQIAADGEGATKLVRIDITGAKSESDAKAIARAIANSPLVKCAMHGNDPNWGRIISIAGIADAAFDPNRCALKLQKTLVYKFGRPVKFNPTAAAKSLAAKEVVIDLALGLGKSSTTVWTCDLSKEYVTINADYHT